MTEETSRTPAMLFDLDGTLIDSGLSTRSCVARRARGAWSHPRRVAHSSANRDEWRPAGSALSREIGHRLSLEQTPKTSATTRSFVRALSGSGAASPGARELLQLLSRAGVPYAVADQRLSGGARPALERLGPDQNPRHHTARSPASKAGPDLFLALPKTQCTHRPCNGVGDNVWDLLQPGERAVWASALLSGGYGKDELGTGGRLSRLPGSGRLVESPR